MAASDGGRYVYVQVGTANVKKPCNKKEVIAVIGSTNLTAELALLRDILLGDNDRYFVFSATVEPGRIGVCVFRVDGGDASQTFGADAREKEMARIKEAAREKSNQKREASLARVGELEASLARAAQVARELEIQAAEIAEKRDQNDKQQKELSDELFRVRGELAEMELSGDGAIG